ncbi:hypothetical protein BGZ72_003943 [Mortierella alpina]|nr:hypothetical protein BGZ72_003943 [Mortierella alpina]
MLVRKTFMQDYERKRPTIYMLILLNAMFSVGCMYSDDPLVKQAAVKYFGRAKLILDETFHVPTISTIQALLLMAHHQGAHGSYAASYVYPGIAYRMATVCIAKKEDQTILSRLSSETDSGGHFIFTTAVRQHRPGEL